MIKLFWPFCIVILLSAACKNKEADPSPYADILARPPFADLTDSIGHDKKNDLLYARRGGLLYSNHFPEPALADFRKAWSIRKQPNYARLIVMVLGEKNPDSAIQFLQLALKEFPDNVNLKSLLISGYLTIEDYDKALPIVEQILQKYPNDYEALGSKAVILDKKGDKKAAIEIFEKLHEIDQDNLELSYMLALKYAEIKNSRVIAFCDTLIKKDSVDRHAEPYYYKGIYYSNIGDRQKALASFNEAIKTDYNFLDGYIEKSAVLYEMRKIAEAIKTLNLALTISPEFADAYYWLGKCQEATGQKEDASLNYQKALGLDPTMKEAAEGIKRLKN